MRACIETGSIVACEVVWAEVVTGFAEGDAVADLLDGLGVRYSPLEREAALIAAAAFRTYRRAGGRRQRIAADFLIGAHAATQAEQLLTRDRDFFDTYFNALAVKDPANLR